MTIFLFPWQAFPLRIYGKIYVFSAAVKEKFYWLAILGVLNSAISVYYYLRYGPHVFQESERRSRPPILTGLCVRFDPGRHRRFIWESFQPMSSCPEIDCRLM
jgi:NADH-quinone oxidoreductase subunit N